ncbi:MAG TPA: histidinol-phosphate transaminase [Candidatus Polarisedimenticolia bacterium]|nr:histidinol-phosphate transaminase [Candidatus Polarisedimenticolia bacterium]
MKVRVPDHILQIAPYIPGKPIEEAQRQLGLRQVVKLASNENPLGPSPRAVQAIRDAASRVHRYPDSHGHDLRQALAGRLGVPPDQIVLGNGSTEIVELLAKAFLSRERGAIVADQSFIMYPIAVRTMGAPLRLVPLKDHRHDLGAMAAACDDRTSLVYIANPNNPTGTAVDRAGFEAYFRRVPGHVLTVIDEAYRDYVDLADYPDGLDDLRQGRNVVLLRTFSKIHGLAGMRIGYAVTVKEVAQALEAVRSPFNTSVLAQAAAVAALEDEEHTRRSRDENSREARFLAGEMTRRGMKFVPSVANFFLVFTPLRGEETYQALLREGVIVRPMEAYGFSHAVRVSIGTHDELERFLEVWDRPAFGDQGRKSRASHSS